MPAMSDFLQHIARSLGRSAPLTQINGPVPGVDQRVARLVGPDSDLVDRFVTTAESAKMHVVRTSPEALPGALADALRRSNLRSGLLTRCPLCEPLRDSLRELVGDTPLVFIPRFELDVHDLKGLRHTGEYLLGERSVNVRA